MPMNTPAFTTDPHRVARLQFNYDDGLSREKLPIDLRERLDIECVDVTPQKLRFLFQNALESYPAETKNAKVAEYNTSHATPAAQKSFSYLRRFLVAS